MPVDLCPLHSTPGKPPILLDPDNPGLEKTLQLPEILPVITHQKGTIVRMDPETKP